MTLHIRAPSSDKFPMNVFSFVWSFSFASLVIVYFLNNSVLVCTAGGSTIASLCVQPKIHLIYQGRWIFMVDFFLQSFPDRIHVLHLFKPLYIIYTYRSEQSELLVRVKTCRKLAPSPVPFQNHFFKFPFSKKAGQWVTIYVSFKRYHWVFNLIPTFWSLSWRNCVPNVRTCFLRNS